MQVCETFLKKKRQTVMWHCEFEQSIHVQQPRGLDRGGKVLAKGQGQDFSLKAKAKAWGVKAKAKAWGVKAKTFMSCPRGSSRPRPGLEENKTEIIPGKPLRRGVKPKSGRKK